MQDDRRDQDTVRRLTAILRRDLRLGDGASLGAETLLAGADIDLDSLDILLLVTSIEKEFGIGIPNEAVTREAFTSVGTLARFVQERHRTSGA